MTETIPHALALLAEGCDLPSEIAERAFQVIMNGGATPAQMGALLMGLRIKGETVAEIVAGARVLRAKALKIKAPEGAIDTCGTGGDGRHSYNISTAAAIVLAACGVPVVKHGNRAASSRSGSADVLQALGIRLDPPPEVLERCLAELHIAFLMAPAFHKTMRHVAPIRQELGLRTIFNSLGPLSNPAAPPYQLMGVADAARLETMAEALAALGTRRAWVVRGEDGLDEMSITGVTRVIEVENGAVGRIFEVTPDDAGLPRGSLEDLRGGDASANAKALEEALSGLPGAHRNAVVYNAAAGLVIAQRATSLKEAVHLAQEAIDSGRAFTLIRRWSALSQGS